MRIRHRARESTFSTCDSSSVSRIHCEDNYVLE
ncbi:hypothetical protein T01_12957 [Trichinella spiralis]|uniref:Uncharacterized protein n=1 Tax=Trichinella spiralis TaxID=6334 RepID=A0A0V1A5S4_TRISP|nr:hypothetical protein T01_12957 [Trichinella spiralis]